MKKIILFLIITIVFVIQGFGQDDEEFETLFKEVKISGFVAPMMSFTHVGDDFAHMMGGGVGIIFNDFFFGGYGMGLTTEYDYMGNDLGFGHGGFWLGYTLKRKKAIHPVLHATAGWGAITEMPSNADSNIDPEIIDNFYVICPTAELEMNFSRFFKFGVGVNYTLVYGCDANEISDQDFQYPGVFVSLKFGWFQ